MDGEGRSFIEDTFLENVSEGGVYLASQRMVVQGANVSLLVRLSTMPPERPALRLKAEGIVRRVERRADSYGVAIEFQQRRVV